MLNPAQPCLAQFPGAELQRLLVLDAIQPFTGEALGKAPRLRMQRLDSGAPALLAKETGLMGIVESRLRTKRRAARNAAIEARQPAAQPHRPKGEVAQRQVPIAGALDFPRGQQDQPEHGLGHFVLRKNKLRDLADHREPGAETVIALRLVKGLEQVGLLDAHEIAGFPLDVPDLHVREDLERRAVTVLQAARARGHAPYPPTGTPKKTHQAIRFAQGKCLQDDGFRFPRRHEQSARRRCAGQTTVHRPKRAHTQKYCNYHTRTPRAILAWRISEKTMPPTAAEGNRVPFNRTAPSAPD